MGFALVGGDVARMAPNTFDAKGGRLLLGFERKINTTVLIINVKLVFHQFHSC